jgi:rhodanese-related sulfurtransferase
VALAACAGQATDPTWAGLETRIAKTFPDVPSIDTATLSELMQDPLQPVVLIDVREADEFAVSHLEGAMRATSLDHAAALVADAPEGATIVVYCSVGYRSAGLAARLQDRESTQVYNLEGSIFRWANEGRPLYRGHRPVRQVHPFDESWGALLHSDLRTYTP